jgi:hypothetical protein
VYIPRKWEFGSALSKLQNWEGVEHPPPFPRYATVSHNPNPQQTAGTIENVTQCGLSVRQVLTIAFLLVLTARQGFASAVRDRATLTYHRDDRYTSCKFIHKHIRHVSSFLTPPRS